MDRSMTMRADLAAGGSAANSLDARLDTAAQTAHNTTDRLAQKAVARVDRASETVHQAVDSAADAAKSAARWASDYSERAKVVQSQLTESASASIRARPIMMVTGALVVGYLLGRLARF